MKGFINKLVLTVALVIVMSSVVLAESTFSDVKAKDWYYKTVIELANRGGIAGYQDGTFKPNNTITFSEFLKMSMSSATKKEYPAQAGQHWATGVYEEAIRQGIIDGKEFPGVRDVLDKPIIREDMALILLNINIKIQGEANVDTSKTAAKIKDFDKVSANRKAHILQAYEKGLIAGKPGIGVDSKNTTTRAEAATVLIRMLDKEFRVDPNKPVETPTGGNVVDLSNPNRIPKIKAGDTVILENGEKIIVKMGKHYLGEGQGINQFANMIGADGKVIVPGSTGISVKTEGIVSPEVIAKYKATGAELPESLAGRYRKAKNGDYILADLTDIIHTAYFMDLPDVSTQKIGDISPCGFYKVVPHQAGEGRGIWEMQL